ncbi:RluA family pseudouridine synthase [Desulfuribacillus alkaliarsenatis]|uniref:Pseudouridine synthase n=1 Tax=Desulfuribacillus alkaliarsenatis TaxID=766136 RepID=A0A1E5FZ05_9FIRM|nr:RluA family pseudouridine synthase [Desulfuribacillus alkaliarsenatis]OEF95677.1 RNA pseudouridine synthase [Desulfuribacillus alkaliarsenatis]
MNQRNKQTIIEVVEETELMQLLLEKLQGKSRNNIKSILARGQVSINNKVINQFNHIVRPGQQIAINWSQEAQPEGLKIIFEDEYLIVIEKSHGLLSMATAKEKEQTAYSILSNHVKKKNPKNRIFIVHRLDQDTSGIMLFAKSQKIKDQLQENWQGIVQERSYIALVEGIVGKSQGTITSWLVEGKNMIMYSSRTPNGGKKAITHYKVLKTKGRHSLLEVNLETGRKNQIRVHMQDIAHSIVGDKKYGAKTNPLKRLGLHARVLAFKHPVSNKLVRFETPIPQEFLSLFQ